MQGNWRPLQDDWLAAGRIYAARNQDNIGRSVEDDPEARRQYLTYGHAAEWAVRADLPSCTEPSMDYAPLVDLHWWGHTLAVKHTQYVNSGHLIVPVEQLPELRQRTETIIVLVLVEDDGFAIQYSIAGWTTGDAYLSRKLYKDFGRGKGPQLCLEQQDLEPWNQDPDTLDAAFCMAEQLALVWKVER